MELVSWGSIGIDKDLEQKRKVESRSDVMEQ